MLQAGLCVNPYKLEKSIYDVLLNNMSIIDAKHSSEIPYLDLIPSNIDLTGAEIELVPLMARETKLKKV